MRNLIAFFKRFQVFMAFVLLQVLALYLYVNYMSFPKSQYLTSASIVTGNVLKAKNDVTKLLNLSRTNRVLQQKIIELRQQRPESFFKLDRDLFRINDTLFQQQYEYIPATVINSTFDKRNNFFTLDVGRAQGIKREMGVFSDKGVVGIVHFTSEHFCVVKSVLTENINIDVMVENNGAFGLLKWNSQHARYGNISGISNDMRVKKWSKVVTRGGAGIFPKGIPVGKIAKIKSVEGKPLWDIEILFAEDFRKIQSVYVIKNLFKAEQKKIESLIPADKEE
jgi:rod shape-determining protein MreC